MSCVSYTVISYLICGEFLIPLFLTSREQRVTGTLVFLMIGMSVLMTKILRVGAASLNLPLKRVCHPLFKGGSVI